MEALEMQILRQVVQAEVVQLPDEILVLQLQVLEMQFHLVHQEEELQETIQAILIRAQDEIHKELLQTMREYKEK